MTPITRRKILGAASASAAFLATPSWAQPKGPVKLVVGYPPGGPADVIARAMVESLKASLGVSVVVDNRPGAGGRVAADQVRNAATDGSVLLVTPASVLTLAPHLFKSVRYELERDFTPLVPIARLDLGIYVGAGTPESEDAGRSHQVVARQPQESQLRHSGHWLHPAFGGHVGGQANTTRLANRSLSG